MRKFNVDDIEELKEYFAPKPETVTALPDKNTVPDYAMVIIKGSNKLYIMVNGEWKLVSTLS